MPIPHIDPASRRYKLSAGFQPMTLTADQNDLGPLSRYSALLRVTQTLAKHRTVPELLRVLSGEFHGVVPFEYLALILHDDTTDEMRLVVLEPESLPDPPMSRVAVSEAGPAATVWQTQCAAVIPIAPIGDLPP